MSALQYWFEDEYQRLWAEGKSPLAQQFQAFIGDFFTPDYDGARLHLPTLYAIVNALGEPAWRLVLSYYHANILIYWQGELARGLQLIIDSTVQAAGLTVQDAPIVYHVHEVLLHTWLEVDAPGQAESVLAAADHARSQLQDTELVARYDVVRARCLAQLGRADDAIDAFHSALTGLGSPPAFLFSLRGSIAGLLGAYEQAAADYAEATRAFEVLGYHIEANASRISQGYALLLGNRLEEAMTMLTAALLAAQNSINRAHVGMAQGSLGQVFLRAGYPDQASTWMEAALSTLEDLGWLRYEAEIAVERVEALLKLGSPPSLAGAIAEADRRVSSLRAADLQKHLAALLSGEGHDRA